MSMGPGEWMVVIAVLLVLFGGKKIPEMARGLGQAQREFRKGLEDDGKNTGTSTAAAAASTAAPATGVASQAPVALQHTAVAVDEHVAVADEPAATERTTDR